MTTALFYRHGADLVGFRLSGHAGYAESGSDIVCSAVSAASHMTCLGLTEILGLCPEISIDEKKGILSCLLGDADLLGAQSFLQAFEAEMCEIQRQYPDYIRIINREWR